MSADNAIDVQRHYDQKPSTSIEERAKLETVDLKTFNNWIKAALIEAYLPGRGKSVLDLCCGKGGDLRKFLRNKVRAVVGIDISPESIEECNRRYDELRESFLGHFYVGDICKADISNIIGKQKFDLVSCQFAFHYSFESEEKVRTFLKNVANHMYSGSYFIGTIPDANWIIKKLKHAEGLKFGNSVYSIEFEQKEEFPLFGLKYIFYMKDSIDYCPEYITHFPTFQRLAQEYGLRLVKKKTFHKYYQELSTTHHASRLKINKALTPDEWEAVGLYLIFAFIKD